MSMTSKYTGQNISFSGCDMVVSLDIVFPDGTKLNRTIGSLQTLTYSIHMEKFPVRSLGNANAKDYTFGPRTIAGSLIFAVFNKHFAYEIMEVAASSSNLGKYHFLMDEMPPFNITVSFANEYGETARLALYGVRIINEGQTMSVNDIYTENTYQFVATDIEYLTDDTRSSSESLARTKANEVMTGVRTGKPSSPIPSTGNETESKNYNAKVDGNNLSIGADIGTIVGSAIAGNLPADVSHMPSNDSTNSKRSQHLKDPDEINRITRLGK